MHIIGHGRYARETYPATPLGAVAAFARNAAISYSTGQLVVPALGVRVPWSFIDSVGAAAVPANTFDVPITPKVTGVVRVVGTVQFENPTGGALNAVVQLQLGATPILPPVALETVDNSDGQENPGAATLSFVFDLIATTPAGLTGGPLPLNVLSNLSVLVSADSDGLVLGTVTLDIQELPAATG